MQLKTRREFARLINERGYKTVVEVGVGNGGFSEFLLTQCPLIKLISIDPWVGAEFRPGSKEITEEKLAKFGERSLIISSRSVEASFDFKENATDFVYIDGDHGHPAIVNDINAWWPKVSPGGIMAGHDYIQDHKEVIKAVDNFSKNTGLKANITGIEDTYTVEFGEEAQAPSWWFEKGKDL
jgi:predicted O-methyltransferase YrrM